MMPDITNPAVYSRVRESMISDGAKPSQVDSFLKQKLSQAQTVQFAKSGLIDSSEAAKSLVDVPGAVNMLSGISSPEDAGTSEQKFKLKQAGKTIDELQRLYGRGSSENVGTKEDLSLASSATGLGKTLAKGKSFLKKQFDSDFQEDVNIYGSQLELAKGVLTQALGSGTPQAQEALALLESAPNTNSTDNEAKQWFNSVRRLIGIEVGPEDTGKTAANTATATSPDQQYQDLLSSGVIEPEEKKKDDSTGGTTLEDVALKASKYAPGALGLAAGVAGSALGPLGSALGATVGTGAGVAVQNLIEDIANQQDETSGEQLEQAITQAGVAGATDLAFSGVFKLLSKGGSLVLKSASKSIDDIPLRGIRANPSQLRTFSKKHGEDMGEFLIRNKLLGENAIDIGASKAGQLQDAFDSLALNENIEIPVSKLKERFADEIRVLAGASDEGLKTQIVPKFNKKIAKEVLDEWGSIVNQLGDRGTITPKELTTFRRMIDDVIPESQFVDPSTKNIAVRVRKIFNDVTQEGVDARLIGEGQAGSLKSLGRELSKYYDFLETAEKQSHLGRGNLAANLTRIGTTGVGGTIGAMVGGAPGAIVGSGVGLTSEALLRDPEVLYTLYKMGKIGKDALPRAKKVISAAGNLAAPAIGVALGTSAGQ